jgi:hypothetical protein
VLRSHAERSVRTIHDIGQAGSLIDDIQDPGLDPVLTLFGWPVTDRKVRIKPGTVQMGRGRMSRTSLGTSVAAIAHTWLGSTRW